MKIEKPRLTVLTDPLPVGRDCLPEHVRTFARLIKYSLVQHSFASHARFRGHFAVTRSLVNGLENIGASFNYNPRSLGQLAGSVVVLAGVRTLRQAIRLKQQGWIRRLFAGPNVVHFSSDFDSLLASAEVDAAITPCDWVVQNYIQDCPTLRGRIFSWPAGVDTNYWTPDLNLKRRHILIFDKRSNEDDPRRVEPYARYLQGLGWDVEILTRVNGEITYSPSRFRELLQRACLMVGFTVGSESQGIAWAEAWASDVPTLLWRNTRQILHGRWLDVSTAPYLNEKSGLFFDDLDDFKTQFSYWQENHEKFEPREWVLENMSDEACANLLYKKVMTC